MPGSRIRAPAVSGRFYPGDHARLAHDVQGLLTAAATPQPIVAAIAAIVPHAGYVYSGLTAAHVFARLELPGLVVVLAPNHTGVCRAPGGVSLWESGAFETPLGPVAVDSDFGAALLAASPLVGVDHAAHTGEHAVEVELPFLLARRADVRIVPLVLAWDDWDRCRSLGEALAGLIARWAEPVLLLASSDLNHYESATVGERKDALALEAVERLDGAELLARCRREHISMCGRAPTAAVLAAAGPLGATRATVVDYRHSGWVSGDSNAVVGYGGAIIT